MVSWTGHWCHLCSASSSLIVHHT